MDYQPPFQHWPLDSFSGPSTVPCSSEGSQIYGLDSSNSPNVHVSFQSPMPDAEFVDQGAFGGACRFRRLHAEDSPKRQLYTMALEHFFLRRDPADSSPVYCIICREYFGDARDMLRHLTDCNEFDKGEYFCPSCNTWEHFKTSSRKKCSWLRTHLANKIKKGFEEALKRLPGSKPAICSKCHGKMEAEVQSIGHHTAKPSWASSGEEGLTAPNFSTSSAWTNQQCNKPQPAQMYPVPQFSPLSELGDTPVRELYDTSRTSELSNMDIGLYSMGAPQASSLNFPHGIPEMGSSAAGSSAFPELADEQTFLVSSNPSHTPAETSPLASYYTSPTEVSSVAPVHTGHTVSNVSPTSSLDSSSGGSSRRAHPSPGKSFSASLHNFAAAGLNGCSGFGYGQSVGSGTMPAAFVSHPTVSRDSFLEDCDAAVANMTASQSLKIDTTIINAYASSSTWGPQNFYGATPTTGTFQAPLIRATTNPSNGVPRPNIAANVSGSPMPAHSFSSVSPSLSSSPSSSSSPSTATASPTSDASGPASTGAAGAGLSLQCPDCDFRPSGNAANFAAYMRKHRRIHSPRRVNCPYCKATFTRPDNCKNHIRTAHGDGRHAPQQLQEPHPDGPRRRARVRRERRPLTARSAADEEAAAGGW